MSFTNLAKCPYKNLASCFPSRPKLDPLMQPSVRDFFGSEVCWNCSDDVREPIGRVKVGLLDGHDYTFTTAPAAVASTSESEMMYSKVSAARNPYIAGRHAATRAAWAFSNRAVIGDGSIRSRSSRTSIDRVSCIRNVTVDDCRVQWSMGGAHLYLYSMRDSLRKTHKRNVHLIDFSIRGTFLQLAFNAAFMIIYCEQWIEEKGHPLMFPSTINRMNASAVVCMLTDDNFLAYKHI